MREKYSQRKKNFIRKRSTYTTTSITTSISNLSISSSIAKEHLSSSSYSSELLIKDTSPQSSTINCSISSDKSILNPVQKFQFYSSKFFTNLPICKMLNDDCFEERSLSEIGFGLDDEWDECPKSEKTDLMELLSSMIYNYEFTNVKIKIDQTTFNCHMLVLQCYSEYFREMNGNVELIEIEADKVSTGAFVMIYEWMLTKKPAIKRKGILPLFIAAQFLRIRELVDQCWVCVDAPKLFYEDAAFMLYLEARQLQHELLQQLMLKRIFKFFLTLVASKDFLELTAIEVGLLLRSNNIGVNSETDVLMAAVRWLDYDWANRKESVVHLMKCVRFGLMNAFQLVTLKRNSDSPEIHRIIEINEVKEMIDDALSYVTTKDDCPLENRNDFMNALQLTEPVQRPWIHDKYYQSESDMKFPTMHDSYRMFLEYLQLIRAMGTDHWKGLQYTKQNDANSNEGGDADHYLTDGKLNKVYRLNDEKINKLSEPLEINIPNKKEQKVCVFSQIAELNKKFIFSKLKFNSKIKPHIRRSKVKQFYQRKLLRTISDDGDHRQPSENVEEPRQSIAEIERHEQLIIDENHFKILKFKITPPPECPTAAAINRKFKIPFSEFNYHIQETPINYEKYATKDSLHLFNSHSILLFGGLAAEKAEPIECKNNEKTTTYDGRQVLQYLPELNDWQFVSRMPMARKQHEAVLFQGKIYVTGGKIWNKSKWELSNSMWSFNPITKLWYTEICMPFARRYFSFIVLHLQLYAIGGEDVENIPISSVLRYDPVNGLWKSVRSMHHKRSAMAACVHKNQIWVAGGRSLLDDQNLITKSIECYNPITNQWKLLTSELSIPRFFGKLCSIEGFLCIIGGATFDNKGGIISLSSIDYYDEKTLTWTGLADMDRARRQHTVVLINSQIIIIAGINVNVIAADVECFCTKRLKWIDGLVKLSQPIIGMNCVVLS